MNSNVPMGGAEETSGRLWRFGDYEFDELRRDLRVKGKSVELEAKPLEVLLELLLHAGEVVTKEELLEAVWPDVIVVDGSLATAISKLRKAMGDDESRRGHGSAHRLPARRAGPTKWWPRPDWDELGLKIGDMVPGRDQWRLARSLDVSAVERGLAGRASQDPRAAGLQVRRRRRSAERPEARSHALPAS